MSEFTPLEHPHHNILDNLKGSIGRIFKERYTVSGKLARDEVKFAKISDTLSDAQKEEVLSKLRQTVKGRVTRTIIQDAVVGTIIVGGGLFIYKNRKAILSKFQKQPDKSMGSLESLKMIAHPEVNEGSVLITDQLRDALRAKGGRIEHFGEKLTIGGRLGAGGTKTVYDAEIGGQHFALALPNTTDGVVTMSRKWASALKEPEITDRIRSLGIHVNPVCEPYPVKVNGVPLTAIRMMRFQDLPFPVVDSKNQSSSTLTASILSANFNADEYVRVLEPALPDLAKLIKAGLHIGGDSMNLCVADGKILPYLNDLGSASFEQFVPGEAFRDSVNYVSMLENAYRAGLTTEEYNGLLDFFFSSAVKSDNPQGVIQRLARQLVNFIK